MPDEVISLHVRGVVAASAGRLILSPPELPDTPFNYSELLRNMRARYREIIETITRPAGVKILIETHRGGLVCSPSLAMNLVDGFNPADTGLIVDLANFALEGAVAPTLAVAIMRDYVDCVHVGGARRVPAGVDGRGRRLWAEQFCEMGESSLDVSAWLNALFDAGLHVPLIVEDYRPNLTGEQKLREGVEFIRRWHAGRSQDEANGRQADVPG